MIFHFMENRVFDSFKDQKRLLSSVAFFVFVAIYQATVINEDNNAQETYVSLTEGTFKTRYLNHTSSFRNKKSKKRHSLELSKHIWSLKESNTRFSIKWKIIKKCQPCSNKTKRCNLCLYEKLIIIRHPELSSLNKRNELI